MGETKTETVTQGAQLARAHTHTHTGEEAVLEYSVRPDGSLDLVHTEVPPSQRGKGLGGILAEVTIETSDAV